MYHSLLFIIIEIDHLRFPLLMCNEHQRHQGQIGAALVLGGVDITGPQLFTIAPHGSTDKLPYVTMGSGSLAAMAVFEASWRPNMEVRPLPATSRRVSNWTAILIFTFIAPRSP